MPKISVIVPVYNTEKYLHRCIDSILAQTFTDFELLLIDDGSKDSSGSICDEYAAKDSRVRVFHKENGGVSSARNLGLDNAQGEWVTFCDSDDEVKKRWLQTFDENAADCLDMVSQGIKLDYSRMQSLNMDSICVGFDYEGGVPGALDLLYQYWMIGNMPPKIFRLEIIRRNNLSLDLRFNYMEDEEFVLRYLKYCKNIKIVKTPGYCYYSLSYEQLDRYNIRCQFELYQSLFSEAYAIIGSKSSPLVLFYLNQYTSHLIEHFRKEINVDKMKIYKKTVGAIVLSSRMFWITKWIIYLDPTALLSSLLLFVHSKFKPKNNEDKKFGFHV